MINRNCIKVQSLVYKYPLLLAKFERKRPYGSKIRLHLQLCYCRYGLYYGSSYSLKKSNINRSRIVNYLNVYQRISNFYLGEKLRFQKILT